MDVSVVKSSESSKASGKETCQVSSLSLLI